jgi:hypothetical protein
MLKIVEAIAQLLAFLVFAVSSIAVAALLITCSWNWFIVPVSGAHVIDFSEGLGLYIALGIVIKFVRVLDTNFDDITNDNFAEATWLMLRRGMKVGVANPMINLMIAWVYHTFFMQ